MSKTKGSFAKKTSKKQKIYRMKGCSKTRKNYLGGSTDTPLAYTGEQTFLKWCARRDLNSRPIGS